MREKTWNWLEKNDVYLLRLAILFMVVGVAGLCFQISDIRRGEATIAPLAGFMAFAFLPLLPPLLPRSLPRVPKVVCLTAIVALMLYCVAISWQQTLKGAAILIAVYFAAAAAMLRQRMEQEG